VLEQRSSASIDVLDLVEVAAAEEDCSQLAEVESHLVMLGTEGVDSQEPKSRPGSRRSE